MVSRTAYERCAIGLAAPLRPAGAPDPEIDAVTPAVVIGLDGGYLRSRHRHPERNFEVVAGKVFNLDGSQHRFAFARNGNSVSEFTNALVSAGVRLGTPATVLSDGDAGLWKLQRQVMPEAMVVLDWRHVATRFEQHPASDAGIGRGRDQRAFWRSSCSCSPTRQEEPLAWSSKFLSRALGETGDWFGSIHVCDLRGAVAARRHIDDLIEYLHANHRALANYGRRRHKELPISTAFVESAVNENMSKRMIKKQQMWWNRWTVQPFLDVRVAVLNKTLCGPFKRLYPVSQTDNDNCPVPIAA